MPKNTTLAERLKQQHSREKEIIQDLTQEQLQNLRNELKSTYSKELATIKSDIQATTKAHSWKRLKSHMLAPLMVGLSLCVGLLGGSWGLMQYMSNRITHLTENVAKLEEQGGKVDIQTCGKEARPCVQIDPKAGEFGEGFMVIKEI